MLARAGVIAQTHKAPSIPGSGYYRTITFDQPASDLTDFPVLVSGTYTYLKTIANGGLVNNANGYDIVFYSDSGLTTKLKFERAYWNAATGLVEFWVKIPTLTSASPTVIYMAYGNTSISTDQQEVNNTWASEYKGVYHFGDGTTLSLSDSTSNANTGVLSPVVFPVASSTAKIGGAVYQSGGNEFIKLSNNISPGTGPITISLWAYVESSGVEQWLISDYGSSGDSIWLIRLLNTDKFQFFFRDQVDVTINGVNTSSVSLVTWYHIVIVRDGINGYIYFNGVQEGTASDASLNDINTDSGGTPPVPKIGGFSFDDGGVNRWQGRYDELKIALAARNADWIAAEYSNQNDPANFYSIGSQVAL